MGPIAWAGGWPGGGRGMREHDAGPAMMRAQLHTALLATMVDGAWWRRGNEELGGSRNNGKMKPETVLSSRL